MYLHKEKWAILVIDEEFNIINVIYNNFFNSEYLNKFNSILGLLNENSINKFLDLFLELKEKKSVFGWELVIPSEKDKFDVMKVGGIFYENNYFIIIYADHIYLYEEMMAMNNELICIIREKIKNYLSDEIYYKKFINIDEISLINNELINTKRELVKKNIELEKAINEKNQLIRTISHDLKNPIGSIFGLTKILKENLENVISEEDYELLSMIESASNYSLKLISETLDFSKMENDYLFFEYNNFDLNKIIKECIQLNKIDAENKKIIIHFITSLDELLINIDKIKIMQVFNNLISNAIKYSKSGTKVTINLDKINNTAVISVKDEGLGIDKSEIDKIFTPFYKTKIMPTAGELSTGLGLSIVKKIIEAYSGSITVKSEIGKGSEFIVKLPIK